MSFTYCWIFVMFVLQVLGTSDAINRAGEQKITRFTPGYVISNICVLIGTAFALYWCK